MTFQIGASEAGEATPRPGGGAGPGSEELQERLVGLHQALLLLTLLFYLASNAIRLFTAGLSAVDLVRADDNRFLVSLMLVNLAVWTLARWRPLPRGALLMVDALAILLLGGIVAIEGWTQRAEPFVLPTRFWPITLLAVMRAVLVPGSAVRAALLASGAVAPLVVVSALAWSSPGEGWPEGLDPPAWGLFAVRALAVVGAAAYLAHVVSRWTRGRAGPGSLGPYTLEERIGEGPLGQVWKARHELLQRPTALKLLVRSEERGLDAGRFERTVRLACRLRHPGTVSIHDFGSTTDGVLYYAMEYIDGADLGVLVRSDGPQPAARVRHLLVQVCGALAEAHGIGLLHRAIQPSNLILCERDWLPDTVKVADFSLVRDVGRESGPPSAAAATILGTPHYMAPEFYRRRGDVDARADLYSLGCVGFFLLTGRHVFERDSISAVLEAHRSEPAPSISDRAGGGVPEALERAIAACLEKDRDRRPASAADLERMLRGVADLPPWTEEDARRWWSEKGDKLRADRATLSGADASIELGPSTVTEVAIDRRLLDSDG